MKKIKTFVTVLALSFCFTACTAGNAQPSNPAQSKFPPATAHTSASRTDQESVPFFSPIVLADNGQINVTVTDISEDGFWGYTLHLYIENKTDLELMFTMEDVSVNGYMCDPYWAETVSSGKKSNTDVSWFASDFEANSIETVEEITFTLRAYDNADWMSQDLFNESFTISP